MTTSPPPPLLASAALFLDFDGTLVPIAPRPQDVQVPGWVVPLLRRASAALGGALAVISGRPLAQLDAFLSPLLLPAAGAHGAEWRGASGAIQRHAATPPATVLDTATRLARQHPGLLLEHKPSGVALHYRAQPALGPVCAALLEAALVAVPGASDTWQWMQGHCVLELKQRAVSKGGAVQTLLAQAPFAGRPPVFVGDDVTDEDGIGAAQAAGGYGVRVGPGDTGARHRLADVAAVGAWLQASVPLDGPALQLQPA